LDWTEDDIERALGRLDPARDLSDDKIDIARGRAALLSAMASSSPAPPAKTARVHRRTILTSAIAVGLAATLAVIVPIFAVHPPSAAADGPPPLPFEPLNMTVAEVADQANAALQAHPSNVTEPVREASSSGWYADIYTNVGRNGLKTIRPENRHLTWSDDLSGELIVTAGTAYNSDGTAVDHQNPAPGSVVFEENFGPGEFSRPDLTAPTADHDTLTALINALANGQSTSGAADQLTGVTELMNTWTLPDSVHAAMLQVLAEDGDLRVEGTTIDRAGRPAIGLRATSHAAPWFDHIVLLSAETGRIIAVESVYTGLNDELPIPTGTVTNYTLWETTP
jgi:hypothetical protein